ALEAQQHQDIPFEQVVERVQPARSLAHSPLFQVMFSWGNTPRGSLELPGLELAPVQGPAEETAKFDVTLNLREGDGRIVGAMTYATSLFEQETAERYVGCLERVLGAMVADAGQPVERLAVLPRAERAQVVGEWNRTEAEYPGHLCVHQLFEAQVRRAPGAVAVAGAGGTLTYGELNARANRLAHFLAGRGVGPDVRVALCLERSPDMMVAVLAVLKAGGAYVPLDPHYPEDRLRYMLADSRPAMLLTQRALAERFAGPDVPVVALDGADASWAVLPATDPEPAGLGPDHLSYVIYTSGSTGEPKGVMNLHRGMVNRLAWGQRVWALQAHEAVLQKTSLSFDGSVREIFWPLMVGARVVLAHPGGHTDPRYLLETIRAEGIGTLNLVPSMLQLLLDDPEVGKCAGLRRVLCGGEALPASLLGRFRERLPGVELHNLYGPSEAATALAAPRCEGEEARATVPVGRPTANTRVYVLDGSGEPVPVGAVGELYVGGAGVSRGYLDRPALTAERFVADPFGHEPGARLYRTGDLGRWLGDGRIEFLGRNDAQVKVRGFRVEPGEIEARLAEHPGVREGVVLAREDAAGDRRLVAYYVAAEGAVEVEALRSHLLARLPEYMVPAAYVRLEKLPLTPSGKPDRRALPAPEGDAYARRAYEAPTGDEEVALARVWSELLGVERVGRRDNFFELGGHSLLAVRLVERMRRRGLHVEVRALFATPELAELAAAAGRESPDVQVPPNRIPASCEAITPGMLSLVELSPAEIYEVVARVPGGARNVQDIYPLAPLQEGILFHHLLAAEGDPYVVSVLSSFEAREPLDAYVQALQAVVDRHDILRTSVVWEGLREPVQVVWREARLEVEEVELDPAEGDPAERLYERYHPRHHRLDLGRAPLMRLYVARDTAQERWLLLLQRHHLVTDHTTQDLLREEVRACLLGRADELPAPLPFRGHVAQARLGVSRAEHEAFFRKMLGDVEEPTVPFGLLDVRGEGAAIEEARVTVDVELAARLRERARKLGVSAASVCHLAWAQVLARTSGRDDVVFGTTLWGRMQGGEGSDRVLGPFVNTLPIRVRVGPDGVEASVRATQQQLAELIRHEHASLALAQRCSGVLAPMPLFTSHFNYRHTAGGGKPRPPGPDGGAKGMRGLRSEGLTNYPVGLSVNDRGEGFGLHAQAPASVGAERVCGLMLRALGGLLEALEVAPERAARSVEVLPEAERRQVLEEWNRTEAPFPREMCLHEAFEAQVERTPDAVAVAFEAGQLTYAELNARSNRLAHHLREGGVGPDARVAICVERSLEMIVGLLGVLKAGGAYVPLDPRYPGDRLRYMLRD
ncbi:MAG TPA: amino acid adenylation domain-containing protein, partial [Longimicrobiaceae bacterium]|nr:amino acid adenylation domain-containing protein [Longimicrobiaceae bacterium]